MTVQMCETCQGEGRIIRQGIGQRGMIDPPEIDEGECPECNGAGAVSSKLKITNHGGCGDQRVMVIDFDEDEPMISLDPGRSEVCQPKVIVLPKNGRVHLSIEPEKVKSSKTEIQF